LKNNNFIEAVFSIRKSLTHRPYGNNFTTLTQDLVVAGPERIRLAEESGSHVELNAGGAAKRMPG
jgi:hypothetical protein